VEILNLYKERIAAGYSREDVMASIYARGRDNARTPMQWTNEENAGFTTGEPWLPVNGNHKQINAAAALADPDSVFHHYKKLIALRKEYSVIRDGSFTLLCPDDEKVFAYTRDTQNAHLLVICNFSAECAAFDWPAAFDGSRLLVTNYSGDCDVLRPYEACMFYYEDKE